MESPILITGCARSGTSMTAGIIERCGAFGGNTLMGNGAANRKGFYENLEIREKVMKPYLILNGADPKGQKPLPDPDRLIPLSNLGPKIESMMMYQGYEDGPWYYKGAKMTLIWRTWHRAFPTAKWVVVRRKDEDIINSCLHTHFMSAYKDEAGWQSWVNHHKMCFKQMKEAGLDIHEVWPADFVYGDISVIKQTVKDIGLTWDDEAVLDFISPELWSTKNGK